MSWKNDLPRCRKIIEKEYKIVSGEQIYTKEQTFHCMTTLPEEMADAVDSEIPDFTRG